MFFMNRFIFLKAAEDLFFNNPFEKTNGLNCSKHFFYDIIIYEIYY